MEKIRNWLLVGAALITTCYLLMLGWFNMLSLDDYGFATYMSHLSPVQLVKHFYTTWQGRFSGFFVSGVIFKIWGHADSLFSWTIIHLLLGYAIFYLYVRDVLKMKDAMTAVAIAILVSNITIMSVFEISTFYWLCCAGYFLVIYATLLLFYVLFVSRWREWVIIVIAIVCALYISGSAENYTPLVLMVLGIIWLYNIIVDTKSSSFREAFRKNGLLFAICVLLFVGFIVMIVAPGNKVRMQGNDDTMVGFMYQFNLAMFLKKTIIANVIFMLRVLSRSLYWIGVLPIFMYVGKLMHDNGVEMKCANLWKAIGVATMFMLGFIFIAVTSCVYGIGYYPPLRSMSFVSYAIVAYLAYAGCLIGYNMAEKMGRIINGLVAVSAIGWMAFAGYEVGREYPEVKRYHDYVKQRDDIIQQMVAKGNTEDIYVDGFECPGWRSTYSYLRTAINRCVGSTTVVNEPYFPYVVSTLDKENTISWKSEVIREYYNAQFDIFEK